LAKIKRLADIEDEVVVVIPPVTSEELENRRQDYNVLTPKKFGTKYKSLLFKGTEFTWNGENFKIQFNYYTNPFCKWHGLPQGKIPNSRKNRYKLSGGDAEKIIICNSDHPDPTKGVFNCFTSIYSNWSVAEEIKRLIRISTIRDWEPKYVFHKEDCPKVDLTPFGNPKSFYKRGKSKSNSQKWQCKSCGKYTNVLPNRNNSITYHQQRSDILHLFTKLLLNRTPITRTCEILGIGRGTYYDKLEFVYRRCLEFLERHEIKPLQEKEFKEMWLNTDKMTYFLNNVRKKGMGGSKYDELEESNFPTNVTITADVFSRYVFRSDVAYDWNISMNDIEEDTIEYKEDHLNDFVKKNARIPKYSHYPQPPSQNDTQTNSDYYDDMAKIRQREKYIDGLHVNSTYTTIAHYWLIKQLIRASEWRFVTDEDKSLTTSMYRVFAKEFRLSDAYHFFCKTDKTKTRKEAFDEFKMAKVELLEWASIKEIDTKSLRKIAYFKLKELFQTHQFHKTVSSGTGSYNVYANNKIEHPLATIDRGFRWVDCTSDLSSLEPKEIASLIVNVNDNAVNTFIQNIRRRLSILERPLTTARGDGKSYIYSNFNPKYAQMSLTILRTYYNFCLPFKTKEGKNPRAETPAQRLGIADKQFDLKDIIYMQ